MKKIYYLIIGIILMIIPIINAEINKEPYADNIILVNNSETYTKFGFKDLSIYYTPQALCHFDMPFIIKKSHVAGNITIEDLSYDLVTPSLEFSKRQKTINYNIIAENKDYYIVNYFMDIKADNNSDFKVDFVPKINGVSYNKFAWWSSSWDYKKKCNIANPVADYQMKLNISYDNTLDGGEQVTLDSHSQDDFDDIRFTNGAETVELNYWIEKNVSSDYCLLWVNTSGDAYIYVYYGNAGVSIGSNGEDTFLFFDDFSGSSIDITKWEGDTGSVAVSGSTLTVSGINEVIDTIINFPSDKKMVLKGEMPYSSWVQWGMRNDVGSINRIYGYLDGASKMIGTYDNTVDTTFDSNWDATCVYTIKEIHWGDSFDKAGFFEDNIELTNSPITTNIPGADLSIFLKSDNNVDMLIDWVFISKLSSTEPSWSSFGSEEQEGAYFDIKFETPINNSVNVNNFIYSVYANITQLNGYGFNATFELLDNSISYSNIYNGTHYLNFTDILYLDTEHTWYVNVSDSTTHLNECFTFTTCTCICDNDSSAIAFINFLNSDSAYSKDESDNLFLNSAISLELSTFFFMVIFTLLILGIEKKDSVIGFLCCFSSGFIAIFAIATNVTPNEWDFVLLICTFLAIGIGVYKAYLWHSEIDKLN